jgi:hypothetical protein
MPSLIKDRAEARAAKLDAASLDFFTEHGYLVLENVFDPAEVALMQAESDYILELIANSSLAHERLSGRMDWRLTSQGAHIVRKIQPINDLSLLFSEVAADERLVGPLRQIMGDDPVLMEEKLNYKQPLPGPVADLPIREMDDYFPVHNDWAYYRAQNYPCRSFPPPCSSTTPLPTTAPCGSGPARTRPISSTSRPTMAGRLNPRSSTTPAASI